MKLLKFPEINLKILITFPLMIRLNLLYAIVMIMNGPSSYSEVLFSPSDGQLDNQTLVECILNDNFSVRFQLKLRKYI